MSSSLFSRNVLRESQPTGSFLEQLQTIHAVTESTPAARNTRQQVEKRYQEAHAQGAQMGFAEGYAKGEAKGIEAGLEIALARVRDENEAAHQEQIAAFAQDLSQILNQTQTSVEQWYADAEISLASLAVEIARRTIGQELSLNADAVITIAKQVLQEVTTGNKVRIRVNPIQSAALDSRREEIAQSVSHIREIEIVCDPSIKNGIIVESESGVVDGRIESYLQRLADDITEEAA